MNLRPFAHFSLTDSQKIKLCEAMLEKASRKIDYRAVSARLDAVEMDAKTQIIAALMEARTALLERVSKDFNATTTKQQWVNKLELRNWTGVRMAFREMGHAAFASGRSDVSREIMGAALHAVSMIPTEAVRFMEDRLFWISGLLRDDLTRKAQMILAQAIKIGEPLDLTIWKLQELFTPFVGGEDVEREIITPSRLETIVRTNTTEAYNEGRLTELHSEQLAPFVKGIQYSAILDERTTEICEFLHGKVFAENDPAADRLSPPNHFNCRSMLVPVLIDEPDPEFATDEEVETALDMVKAGFGGNAPEYGIVDKARHLIVMDKGNDHA